ncbi:RmuC domain protein [Candidatus Sulfotelmatomonas gaucii]|uniref:RmuC domain protein n=1 Tax=Candidatus Sulfuritelmatomonas gaucii TaxID=2043161 RepID=A0A2N9LJR2_9BACT|nr:RmuC domain protein [Candidatus Sulfotelmatomonas gaucii]
MMQAWIAGVVAAAVGILVGYLLRNLLAGSERALLDGRNRELTDTLNATSNQLMQRDGQILDLTRQNSKLESDLANEKGNGERLTQQFKLLANEILKENSKTFSEGSQKDLGNLLTPLRQQIEDFRKKVEEAQVDSKTSVAKMEGLIGNLGSLNQQLAEEAKTLSTALRGSAKAQGDWGEFILRDLLEKAGLREGDQYSFQQTFTGLENEDGARAKSARTDVIVYLPGGRNLVIDSKVSLTAYTDYVNAPADADRSAALKLHLASVRGHVAGLAKAGYHRLPGLETPDFVVLFVPIEPAFLLALQNDAALWSDAYQQGILLVGPTTLLYIIRIVNVLWQQELQARSVKDVMDRGAELYDKFVNFVADLEAVGKSLRAADQNYSSAMKKLSEGRGNLVRQVEMLKELGIRTGKSLPQNLLDSAAVEEPSLALAASADDNGQTEP